MLKLKLIPSFHSLRPKYCTKPSNIDFLYHNMQQIVFPHRVVMMPDQKKQKVFSLQEVTMSEGEMQGRDFKDLNRWVDETGRLYIKFIIYYVTF